MNKKLIRNKLKSLFKESMGFPKILPLPKEACREEKLKGGLADDKTPEDLAKKHKVTLSDINAQIEKGKDVESEHTNDPSERKEIAMDHVDERPDYYDALDAAGIDESTLNEMPYFTDVPDTTGQPLDLQIEKWATEAELNTFLVQLFSGEFYDDAKQTKIQISNPEKFVQMLLNYDGNTLNPTTQFYIQFIRKFKANSRKITTATVAPEDIEYVKKFVLSAYNKSKEFYEQKSELNK
jgi:hypothetical protein